MFRGILITILCGTFFSGASQELTVRAGFARNSVKIGEHISYGIGVRHEGEQDILFPDSIYDFSPFEFVSKEWYPSVSENGITVDSLVFVLRTFSTDSIQSLQVPFYQVQYGDSSELRAPSDSIVLMHTVSDLPDSLSRIFLLESTDYYRVKKLFNYPYFIAFSVFGLIVIGGGWLLFGKTIMRGLAMRKMRKRYEAFLSRYDELNASLVKDQTHTEATEMLLVHWKKYMEGLGRRPYRKMTTNEIRKINTNEKLISALQNIDKAIYSPNKTAGNAYREFEELRHFTHELYTDKLTKIKHGTPD